MDVLTITLLTIFVTTAIAAVLQRRARDPCLKKFHGRAVILQLKSGQWVWGRLNVYSKSLEIVFEKPHRKEDGRHELSYLLFEDMLPQIQMVLCPHPQHGTADSRLWKRELNRVISRSIWFGIRRSCRNVFNTLRDAFSQSIGVLIGQLRARNPAAMLAGADQKLTSTGEMLATYGSNAYEPILEKYLGKSVVAEMVLGEKRLDHIGFLEEYSDKYLLLRDVHPHIGIPLPPEAGLISEMDAAFPRTHSVVRHLAHFD